MRCWVRLRLGGSQPLTVVSVCSETAGRGLSPSEAPTETGNRLNERTQPILLVNTGGTITAGVSAPSSDGPYIPLTWEEMLARSDVLQRAVMRLGPVHSTTVSSFPIDSSNVAPGHWIEIAEAIISNYEDYCGFVVLHGTDTLSWTASGLSFLIENLAKPVVLTASQLPFDAPRTDAILNIANALEVARPAVSGLPVIPEVCICFGQRIVRGNRARKVSASDFLGFDTPNYPPLGTIREWIDVREELVLPQPSGPAKLRTRQLEPNVMMLSLFPGLNSSVLERMLEQPGLKGILLQVLGSGNVPTNPDFLSALRRARERGIVVQTVTQAYEGAVELGLYESSSGLLDLGVLFGADLTPEAAYCKLATLLGMDHDPDTVHRLMQTNLAGEQRDQIIRQEAVPKPARVVLADINDELIRYLARHPRAVYDLSSRRFEELVAELFKDFGFEVELTNATRDGGRDILAWLENPAVKFLTFVECKKYTPIRRVGVEVVRGLYGVQQMLDANKSVVVTTSFFSKPAREEHRKIEHSMDLKDYNDLCEWLRFCGAIRGVV